MVIILQMILGELPAIKVKYDFYCTSEDFFLKNGLNGIKRLGNLPLTANYQGCF